MQSDSSARGPAASPRAGAMRACATAKFTPFVGTRPEMPRFQGNGRVRPMGNGEAEGTSAARNPGRSIAESGERGGVRGEGCRNIGLADRIAGWLHEGGRRRALGAVKGLRAAGSR